MLLRFGIRSIIKSLLIAAGLPSLLAAQNPYSLPNYPQYPEAAPSSGYPVQPQFNPPAPGTIPVGGGVNIPGNGMATGGGLSPSSVQPNISAAAGTMATQPTATQMPNAVQVPGFGMAVPNQQRNFPSARLVSNQTFSTEPTISTAAAFNSTPAQLASCQTCGPSEFSGTAMSGDTSFNCNELPWCDGPSNSGCFASVEALLFFMSKPTVATFGDEASERMVTVNGVTYMFENSLDSSWISNEGAWGQRLDIGNVNQDCGWFVSLWNVKQAQTYNTTGVSFVPADPFALMSGFVDGNADSIDDDLDGDNIYGRSGRDLGTFDAGPPPGFIPPFDGQPDVGAPLDTGDMVNWLQTFSTVASSNKLTLINAELNRLYRMPGHSWAHEVDYYYGIRYLSVKDIYNVTANGGFLGQSVWNAESDNNLIGPQIGMRWSRRNRAVGFSVDGRFFAAYNRQDNDLRGYTASNFAANGAANNPAALTSESFVDGFGNDAFSPTGELRADMILKLSRSWAFKVGYTGLVVGDVSRASPKIVYALPRSSLVDVESDTTLISHGVNFGLEYNR
jgi:hypothetical protein